MDALGYTDNPIGTLFVARLSGGDWALSVDLSEATGRDGPYNREDLSGELASQLMWRLRGEGTPVVITGTPLACSSDAGQASLALLREDRQRTIRRPVRVDAPNNALFAPGDLLTTRIAMHDLPLWGVTIYPAFPSIETMLTVVELDEAIGIRAADPTTIANAIHRSAASMALVVDDTMTDKMQWVQEFIARAAVSGIEALEVLPENS